MEIESTGFGNFVENVLWRMKDRVRRGLSKKNQREDVEFSVEETDKLLYDLEAFCCERDITNFLVDSYEKTGNCYLFRCPCDVIVDSGRCVSFPSGWKCKVPYGRKLLVTKCYVGSLEDIDLFVVCGRGLSLEYSYTGDAFESMIVHLENFTQNTFVVKQGTPLFVCEVA